MEQAEKPVPKKLIENGATSQFDRTPQMATILYSGGRTGEEIKRCASSLLN
ncbi:hypothetical protein QUB19_04800 [Microcoleus sp. B4-C5]|uniref:hypothetical protein n=1 Tax=unclassified Microcoleus TaxID=2642155 RepID=UPI002FD5DF19